MFIYYILHSVNKAMLFSSRTSKRTVMMKKLR